MEDVPNFCGLLRKSELYNERIYETLNVEKNEREFDVIMKINHAFDLLCFTR